MPDPAHLQIASFALSRPRPFSSPLIPLRGETGSLAANRKLIRYFPGTEREYLLGTRPSAVIAGSKTGLTRHPCQAAARGNFCHGGAGQAAAAICVKQDATARRRLAMLELNPSKTRAGIERSNAPSRADRLKTRPSALRHGAW